MQSRVSQEPEPTKASEDWLRHTDFSASIILSSNFTFGPATEGSLSTQIALEKRSESCRAQNVKAMALKV